MRRRERRTRRWSAALAYRLRVSTAVSVCGVSLSSAAAKGVGRLLAVLAIGVMGLTLVAVLGRGSHRGLFLARDISAGTGYAALDLCTRTFVTGQPFEQVLEHYVEPKVKQLWRVWSIEREADRVTVRTQLPGLAHARTAQYRAGLGCTIVPPDQRRNRDGSSYGLAGPAAWQAPALPEPSPEPWPLGEAAAQTDLLSGAWLDVLQPQADSLFEGHRGETPSHTSALLVAYRGQLVYERYGEGLGRDQPQLGWSMTKTLSALVVGTLVQAGYVGVDSPVDLPVWQETAKGTITFRHLLNMTAGLSWYEGYGGASDVTHMLFSEPDQGGFVARQSLESPPGTVFTYSTGLPSVTMLRVGQLLGGLEGTLRFVHQALFRPLGVRHAYVEADASGTLIGGARGVLRPVDWLRLGQLLLRRGEWFGQRVVPDAFVAFMLSGSDAEPGYGGGLWHRPATTIPDEERAGLPADLVWMSGHLGQWLLLVPSQQLAVLRMGVSLEREPTRERVFALLAALADLH